MKKGMRDWRIWAILTPPILFLGLIGYLAIQPVPGSQQLTAANERLVAGAVSPTWPAPTPYPSVAPIPAYSPPPDPCTVGVAPVKSLQATMAVVRDGQGRVSDLKFTVRDEGGKPITCAYLVMVAKVGGASFQSASWTDPNGQVDYEKIPPGRLSISATATRLSLTGSLSATVQN